MRRLALVGLGALVVCAIWRFTPLSHWTTPEAFVAASSSIRAIPWPALLVPTVFVVLGLFMFPVMVLKLATILVFGPVWGTLYAISGAAASALVGHSLGGVVGRDAVERLGGPRCAKVRERLAKSGVIAIALFRMVPLAPFALENMVAGAAGVCRRRFLAGTLIAMVPALVLIVFFGRGLEGLLVH